MALPRPLIRVYADDDGESDGGSVVMSAGTSGRQYRSVALIFLIVASGCAWALPGAATARVSDWVKQASGTAANLRGVAAADLTHCWVVGGNGVILHTGNAGKTWQKQTSRVKVALQDVACAGAKRAWAVGPKGTILHTANGGATWAKQRGGTSEYFRAVTAIDARHAWVVSAASGASHAAVLRTTNGGATWKKVSSAWDLYDVAFADAQHGWTVGEAGYVGTTVDGGAHWADDTLPTSANFTGVTFASATDGWLVGEFNTPAYTTDGGGIWGKQIAAGSGDFDDITCSSANRAWAVGLGTIVHTTSGGTLWSTQTYPSSLGTLVQLQAVTSHGARAWAVAPHGLILRTR
jgi:photosystem II stability/assembly factor-like uncharacterized protein